MFITRIFSTKERAQAGYPVTWDIRQESQNLYKIGLRASTYDHRGRAEKQVLSRQSGEKTPFSQFS